MICFMGENLENTIIHKSHYKSSSFMFMDSVNLQLI